MMAWRSTSSRASRIAAGAASEVPRRDLGSCSGAQEQNGWPQRALFKAAMPVLAAANGAGETSMPIRSSFSFSARRASRPCRSRELWTARRQEPKEAPSDRRSRSRDVVRRQQLADGKTQLSGWPIKDGVRAVCNTPNQERNVHSRLFWEEDRIARCGAPTNAVPFRVERSLDDRWLCPHQHRTLHKPLMQAECRSCLCSEKTRIRAIANIAPGDEITYHYGRDYFVAFIKRIPCKCDACESRSTRRQALSEE